MPKPLLTFETTTATRHIRAEKNLPVLDQRHLRGKVISLQDFHMIAMITEANIISSPVLTGTEQPERVHVRPLNGAIVWRSNVTSVSSDHPVLIP